MQISPDTSLSTARLRLRAASVADVDLVWSASRVPGFNDGMTWDPPEDRATLVEIAAKNRREWQHGHGYTFTIELAKSGQPIGRVGLYRLDQPAWWRIGFWIHPDYHGHGHATEATRAVLDFGFNVLHAEHISTAHATWNTPSRRVIEKLGFRYTGENPCGFKKRGKPVAEREYDMTPATFIKIRPARMADSERLFEIHLAAIRALCVTHYPPDVIDRWLAGRTVEGLQRCMQQESGYVAELGDEVIAYGTATPGEINAVFIDPEHAGQGIGTLVLGHLIALARHDHDGPVRVEASLNAIDFYRKHGFRESGRSAVRRNDVDLAIAVMTLD